MRDSMDLEPPQLCWGLLMLQPAVSSSQGLSRGRMLKDCQPEGALQHSYERWEVLLLAEPESIGRAPLCPLWQQVGFP